MSVGTSWTTINDGTRIINASDGGWIEGRMQWRRTSGNNFDFRMQIRANQNLNLSSPSVRFTVNGVSSTSTSSVNLSGSPSAWTNIGSTWSRTFAQVGGNPVVQGLRGEIQFATWSIVFGGTQIGNGTWRNVRAASNLTTPRVLMRGTTWLTRGGIVLRRG